VGAVSSLAKYCEVVAKLDGLHTSSDFARTCFFVTLLSSNRLRSPASVGIRWSAVSVLVASHSVGIVRLSITLTSLKDFPISLENWSNSVFFPENRLPSFNPFVASRYNFRSSFFERSRGASYVDSRKDMVLVGAAAVLLGAAAVLRLRIALAVLAALAAISS